MPQNWKTYKLEELSIRVCVGFVGTCHKYYTDKGIGVPMIRTTNLTERALDLSNVQYISQEFHSKHKKSQLKKGDILIARHGTNGQACLYENDEEANCLNVVIVKPNHNLVDYKWLLYSINSPVFRNQVDAHSTGSVQKVVNTTALTQFNMLTPELYEQRSIASILSALDDKIELNLQQNKTLEEMAMALYKHWFVDFGPFQDGEFVESELGMIPEGWEVKAIGDIIETLGGGTPKTKVQDYWENGKIDWYSPTDLTRSNSLYSIGTSKKITKLGLQKSSAKMFPKESLLMSSRATIGAITINRKEACTNQGFITMIPNDKLSLYQLHGWTVSNMDLIISKANGSTFKEISKTNFRNLPIVVGYKIQDYLSETQNYYSKIENNILENQTLTKLRDTLLPKLISGEVRLKDVEKTLSEML
jgi:type I restriction enzyme S subunit